MKAAIRVSLFAALLASLSPPGPGAAPCPSGAVPSTPAAEARQTEREQAIDAGLEILYAGDYQGALRHFRKLEESGEDLAGRFFTALTFRWMNFVDPGTDRPYLEAALAALETAERAVKEHPADAQARLYLGTAQGYLMEYHYLHRNWLRLVLATRQLTAQLERALELDPSLADAQLPLGAYDHFTDAALPYQGLLRGVVFSFIPEGDAARGLRRIEEARRAGRFCRVEAETALFYIRWLEGPAAEGLRLVRPLHRRYPDNPTFHEFLGLLELRAGDGPRAARTFQEILGRASAGRRWYTPSLARRVRFRLGQAYARGGLGEAALAEFARVLAEIQPEEEDLALGCDEDSGDIHARSGRSRAAEASYLRALARDPSGERRQRLERKLKMLAEDRRAAASGPGK